MKNILLPTDFSENSLNAIEYALKFFKGTQTNFFVLNVQKTSGYTTSDMMSTSASTSVYKAVLDDNKAKLEKLIDKLENKHPSDSFIFHPLLDFDVFTDAISQAVQKNKIDLIIMGTNGATGAKEVIFGSNTLKVIRQVNCALLTVPGEYHFQKIPSVLLSIDGQNKFSQKGFEPLKEILTRFNSKLKILEIIENASIERKDTKKIAEDIFLNFDYEFFSIKDIPAAIAINAFEQLFPVNLHGLFVKEETFLDRVLFGSETSKISYASKVPLLIMRQ